MTRFAFSADQHGGATHLTTLVEQERALTELVETTIRMQCRALILPGDTTHYSRPTPEVLAMWGRVFGIAQRAGLRIIAIKGNHDGDGVTSLFGYFRGSIDAVTRPTIITDLYGIDLACLPWLPDEHVRAASGAALGREEIAHKLTESATTFLRGFLAQRREGVPMVLATHATIAGAETSTGFNMGFRSGSGYVLPLEELTPFDVVIAGHIHRHQAFETRERWAVGHDVDLPQAGNIIYTGSLLPLDFSEDEAHGFVVWELGGTNADGSHRSKWEFVPVETPDVSTWDLTAADLPALADHGATPVSEDEKIRVRITCDDATAREYPPSRITALLREAGASLVQVEYDIERPDRGRGERGDDDLAPVPALGRYLSSRTDLDDETKDRLLFHGVSVVEALRSTGGADTGGDLEVKRIEAHDLLGVRDATLEFDGHGVYALTGDVGTGKSTVGADAIRFALFGATRYGGKVTDMVIRQGAEICAAAVELADGQGNLYRIVRRVKRTARGATSSLDVLRRVIVPDSDGAYGAWDPLSTGKIADGEAHIDRILGGLTDETVGVSSIVVQREADAFMRARPEQRKQLLAQAAGLSMFDDLAELSRLRARTALYELSGMQGKAEPLRARVATIPLAEHDLDKLVKSADELDAQVLALEEKVRATRATLDKYTARVTEAERVMADIRSLEQDIIGIMSEYAEWERKRVAAERILEDRAQLESARGQLESARAEIAMIEGELVAVAEQGRQHVEGLRERGQMERELERLRLAREREARGLVADYENANRQAERLKASECPVLERITSGEVPACVFLRDAKRDVELLPDLEKRVEATADQTPAETELMARILAFVVPEAATDVAGPRDRLTRARARVLELENAVLVAGKIARAEEVIAQHGEAVAKLATRKNDVQARREEKVLRLAEFGPEPQVLKAQAEGEWQFANMDLVSARGRVAFARTGVGELRGRLAGLYEARKELEGLQVQIGVAVDDSVALEGLVSAWQACRVRALEANVIPAVETTANDVLRQFPYGLTIALRTQRQTRALEMAEALDVEVLGGHAPVYEGCSGGQRTTIDFALHVAVALVVSRRARSRLRFLFCDEPEGLDEAGRAAFAATARWIHETFGITVVVASHAPDLIDALGGRRIDMVIGDEGSVAQVVG